MSEFTRWQKLNESLGFPLGVKSAASFGVASGFSELEESKKKMDVADLVSNDDDDDEDEGDDDEIKVGPDSDSDEGDDDGDSNGGCGCGDKSEPGKLPFMCKKCGKKMKKKLSATSFGLAGALMKKKLKKKNMKESMFDSYQDDTLFRDAPELGSEEYANEFRKSIMSHFGNPNEKFSTGVNLGEEVIFEPQDENAPLVSNPQPGSVGFAPATRIGSELPPKPEKADWEQSWTQMTEAFKVLSNHIGNFVDEK